MHLNDYALAASATAVYPKKDGLMYLALGLAGEVGEVCNKVKKIVRGDYRDDETKEQAAYEAIKDELGDCLWYLSALPKVLGTTFDDVAAANLFKLADRKARGVTKGSGDGR